MYQEENVEGEYGEFLTGLPSPSLHFPYPYGVVE